MKKLHYFASILLILTTTSCDDSSSSSILFAKIKNPSGCKAVVTYKKNNYSGEYEFYDQEDGYSIMELSDGTLKNSNWEPIDPSKGEFAKWKIEKIDHQKVVFIFESFDSYVKQHWRFNFMYKRGNLNKYNAGETVELIPFPNEMKQYSIAQGKADVAAYSLIGFDPIRSSATENLKNYTIYLNQEKIITSFDWDYLAELYISSGLHDRMLLELKYNEVN